MCATELPHPPGPTIPWNIHLLVLLWYVENGKAENLSATCRLSHLLLKEKDLAV